MLEESGKQSKILRIALINVTYPPSNRMDSMLFIQIALNNPATDECFWLYDCQRSSGCIIIIMLRQITEDNAI